MDITSIILDILKITLPSLILMITVIFLIRSWIKKSTNNDLFILKKKNREISLPLRLQAYERLTLLCERIDPNNFLPRIHKTGMTARDLQTAILQEVRSEFEHNISQQVYVSPSAWDSIKTLREEIVGIVNKSTHALSPQATGIDLSKLILTNILNQNSTPNQRALLKIKSEVRELF
jgi:hypothetical protein